MCEDNAFESLGRRFGLLTLAFKQRPFSFRIGSDWLLQENLLGLGVIKKSACIKILMH
jgi:hypothetical protein